MAGLGEQLWRLKHAWQDGYSPGIGHWCRPVLDEPVHYVARTKYFHEGRLEIALRAIDCQRVLNASTTPYRRKGKRLEPVEASAEHLERNVKRAKTTVRDRCLVMKADRMVTFGTRATLGIEVLYSRFARFVKAYNRHMRRLHDAEFKFQFVAVPELHADGEHWHIHCAASGFFRLDVALSIWHALCAGDFSQTGERSADTHGSINVKRFYQRKVNDDVPSIIAGYIAKYCSKNFAGDRFNKHRYWSSLMPKREKDYVILSARTMDEAIPEMAGRFGIDLANVIMCHDGCFFVTPDEKTVWIKLTPQMARPAPF